MFCENCGNKLREGDKFCNVCGAPAATKVVNSAELNSKIKPYFPTTLTKRVFQIISIILLVLFIGTQSSNINHQLSGWVSDIINGLNIAAFIAFIGLITNAWKFRKSGPNNKNWFSWRWISIIIFISVLGLGTVIISDSLAIAQEKALDNPNLKAAYISNVVDSVKSSTTFPKHGDDITTWTNITAEPDAIHYFYTITATDTSNFSTSTIKNYFVPKLCQNSDTRLILDKDINMEYSYFIYKTKETYLVTINKSDCQQN